MKEQTSDITADKDKLYRALIDPIDISNLAPHAYPQQSNGQVIIRYTTKPCEHMENIITKYPGRIISSFSKSPRTVALLKQLFNLISTYTPLVFEEASCDELPAIWFGFSNGLSFLGIGRQGLTYTGKTTFFSNKTGSEIIKFKSPFKSVLISDACDTYFHPFCLKVFVHETLHALHLKHPMPYDVNDIPPFMPMLLADCGVTVMSYSAPYADDTITADAIWRMFYRLQFLRAPISPQLENEIKLLDITALQKHPLYRNPKTSDFMKKHLKKIPGRAYSLNDMELTTNLLPSGESSLSFTQFSPFSSCYIDLRGAPQISYFGHNRIFMPSLPIIAITLPPAETTLILSKKCSSLVIDSVPSINPVNLFFHHTGTASCNIIIKNSASRRVFPHFPQGTNVSLIPLPFTEACKSSATILKTKNNLVAFCELTPEEVSFDITPPPSRHLNFWQWIALIDRAYPVIYNFHLPYMKLLKLSNMILSYGLGKFSQSALCSSLVAKIKPENPSLEYDLFKMVGYIVFQHNVPFYDAAAFQLARLLNQKENSSSLMISEEKSRLPFILEVISYVAALLADLLFDEGLSFMVAFMVLTVLIRCITGFFKELITPTLPPASWLGRIGGGLWQTAEILLEESASFAYGADFTSNYQQQAFKLSERVPARNPLPVASSSSSPVPR